MRFKLEIMAERLYKEKTDMLYLDDRHEILSIYESQCSHCKNFEKWDYFCDAYPNGIPDELLEGTEKHNEVRNDQVGTTIFTPEINESLL